jgi:hypothetical protein
MARVTILSCVVFTISAALIIDTAALAQTPSPASSTIESPKSEGLVARVKAKTQASIARTKKRLADVRLRHACRKEAAERDIPMRDRAEYTQACAHQRPTANVPNVLPVLFISPEALKPNLHGLPKTGE